MSDRRSVNLLDSRGGRRLLFSMLYFSEGAPIGYIWWALPTMLRSAGVAIDDITRTTSMVTLIWVLKFLWAPVVDTVRSERWGLRQWIVLTQICMGLSLLPMLLISPETHLALMTALLIVHAFFASTQDASVDALCITATADQERGGINGWMQVGMLLGRALFGGAALYAESWLGRRGVMLCLIAAIWSSMLIVIFLTREPHREIVNRSGFGLTRALFSKLRQAFRGRWMGWAIGFALIGGTAFEAAGAVAGPLLIDRGFRQEQVGTLFAIPVVITTGIGALAGGALADRVGHARTVAMLTAAIALTVLAIAVAATPDADGRTRLLVGLLVALYFLFGAFSASSYAMFMDLTDASMGATQFSALMGATNFCEAWATFAVGRLVARSGYSVAFTALAIVSLVSIPMISRIRRARAAGG